MTHGHVSFCLGNIVNHLLMTNMTKKKIECELSKEKALRAGVSIRVGPIMETSQNRFEHRWSY